MKYLTPELKAKYMVDFNENVLTCTDEYWGLDNGLKDLLITINSNPNIQTLYSRKCNCNGIDGYDSYLWFLFSKDIDFDRINRFATRCASKHNIFTFEYLDDAGEYIEPSYKIPNMGCVYDKSYLQNGIHIFYMQSKNIKKHNMFWNDIKDFFTTL